jgi:8-oxo-dGTP pyrophosphatase MutT (NUDIX family)
MKSILMNLVLSIRRAYWRIFQPVTRGVRAILVNDKGEVFLVRHSYGTGWYLPGGRVKRGEADLAALHRELGEEAGVRFDAPKKLLGTYSNHQEYKRDTIVVFLIDSFDMEKSFDLEVEAKSFFSPTSLPTDVSPGTRRRIEEWLGQRVITDNW